MKILSDVLTAKLEKQQDLEIRNDYLLAVWNFYTTYNLCLAITGKEDLEVKKKNNLVRELLLSSKKHLDQEVIGKLRVYMAKDTQIINEAILFLEQRKQEGLYQGDFYKEGMIGISTDYD